MAASPFALLTGSLPIPRTRLIGREGERAMARALLVDEAVPLLTLTGPGGSGKTRLAVAVAAEVASRFADGVTWVELASLTDPLLVPATVARALEIIPAPGSSTEELLIRQLRTRQTLLVLDNCEHLLAAVADLVALMLAACPALQVMATSRAPLHLRGEQELAVEPLPLPSSDGDASAIAKNDAVRLFMARARGVRAGFALDESNVDAVAEICRRLDGLPLAIELAAARMNVFSPEALLEQTSDRLRLLAGGPRDAPARQQTLRDTIAWSYELLAPAQQRLFRRLAVFSSGFTPEAAREVAATDDTQADGWDDLTALVDQHLVRRLDTPGESRFTMLETIREFGLERLAEHGEEAATHGRHAAFFIGLVHRLEAWMAPYLPDSQQILDRLDLEYPNLSAALAWLQASGDVSNLLQLAGALNFFWQLRWRVREGRVWLEWGLSQNATVTPAARAMGQLGLSSMLYIQNERDAALRLCEASLRYYRGCGDHAGVARAADHAACIAFTEPYIVEALAALEQVGDTRWGVRVANHLRFTRASRTLWHGDLRHVEQELRAICARNEVVALESGAEHAFACWPLESRGLIAAFMREDNRSVAFYQASLRLSWKFRELRCIAFGVSGIAGALARGGRWEEAARLFGAIEALCERTGLVFSDEMWAGERSVGLPEPWQDGDATFWGGLVDRLAADVRRARPLPPLPDPGRAAALWAAGRRVPIADAVADALAVDLAVPPPSADGMNPSEESAQHQLSPREHDVLALLCQRLTDPQIATRLFLSPRTVESHVASILRKLNAENRRDAAAAAVRLGLV